MHVMTVQIVDLIRATSQAIRHVLSGSHSPQQAHERIRTFYSWEDVMWFLVKIQNALIDLLAVPAEDHRETRLMQGKARRGELIDQVPIVDFQP